VCLRKASLIISFHPLICVIVTLVKQLAGISLRRVPVSSSRRVVLNERSLVLLWRNHIVDFEDHLDDLSCKLELLLLGHDRLEDALLAHVGCSNVVGIDTDEWVLSADLFLTELANILDGVVTGVLGKGEGDFLEGFGEGTNGVLLDSTDLVGLLRNSDGAGKLGGTTATNNIVVLDHVTDDADGVVEAALGLVTDSLRATADHDGDGLRLGAILNQDNFVAGGAVANLLDAAGMTELLGGDLLEAGNDASTSSDGKELNLDATDPTHGGEVLLHEQVVGLVIEAPLAENGSGAGILHAFNHIGEVVLLHLLKFKVISSALDLKAVLGLGLGGLERASKDAHLGILDLLEHLGVGELLVEDDTLNEGRVFDGAASLGDDLDKVEVNIVSLEVSNVEDGLEGEVSVVLLAGADDLGAESGLGASSKLGVIVLEDIELLLDLAKLVHSDITSLLETISDFERVDTLFQKFLGLLEDSTGKDDDTCGAIADLVILGGGQLGQKPGGLVMNL